MTLSEVTVPWYQPGFHETQTRSPEDKRGVSPGNKTRVGGHTATRVRGHAAAYTATRGE